jgi:hypothetical protein
MKRVCVLQAASLWPAGGDFQSEGAGIKRQISSTGGPNFKGLPPDRMSGRPLFMVDDRPRHGRGAFQQQEEGQASHVHQKTLALSLLKKPPR